MSSDYLPYYRPTIAEDDIQAVAESLRNGWLTTGPKTKELESAFASLSGVKHAVAVNSCTAALNLALVALGVREGDEVVMPALTFVAGAECAKRLGAEPVFCDVDSKTLCITPETIRPVISAKTKVVIPMHYGGYPGGVKAIVEMLVPLGIAVLEDAAHAIGTLDGGKWAGTFSDAAALSFYATKNITSAEGGMLLTNRDDIAESARILSLHGMDRDAWKRYMKGGTWRYDVIEFGFKCNLPDLASALGISQLKKLQAMQQRRNYIAHRYLEALKHIPGIEILSNPPPPPDCHSWCVFAIATKRGEGSISRDDLVEGLRERNIGTSVHFIPTHHFSAYRYVRHGDLSVTEDIAQRMLSLPLYPSMTDAEVDLVIDALTEIMRGETIRDDLRLAREAGVRNCGQFSTQEL